MHTMPAQSRASMMRMPQIEIIPQYRFNPALDYKNFMIPGFMVQGGGFEPGMTQKGTDAPIENEANNGLKNANYTVAMARTSDPHSATAQFFINVADNGFLNHTAPSAQGWGYAVFGKVVSGADVVDKIKAVKTGRSGFHDDVPKEDVEIEKAVAL